MKKYIILLFFGILVISCKKNDVLTVDRSVKYGDQPPHYVYDVQDVLGQDSVRLNATVTYQVYIKQQDFYQPGQKYVMSWVPSDQQLDGTLTYNNKAYRQGETIIINYGDIKTINVFNVGYRAFSPRVGVFSLIFTIVDRSGNTLTKQRNLKIY